MLHQLNNPHSPPMKDWIRNVLSIRQARRPAPVGQVPAVGTDIQRGELKMAVTHRISGELWDWLVLSYFVCCGVSRLARYNVTAEALSGGEDKVKYFEGTPIPTSLVLVVVLAVAAALGRIGTGLWGGAWQLGPWQLHPLVLLFAASGSLMVSKTLRIPKP